MPRATSKVLQEEIRRYGWTVGRGTYGYPKVSQWGEGSKLHIGSYCSIGPGVEILLGGNHRVDWVTTFPFSVLDSRAAHIAGHPATKGDVRIGSDVWLATDATILSGVTIGDGACIGAGALVSKDVDPYGIALGNPAKIVKYRFDDKQREELLAIAWWNWPEGRIAAAYEVLLSANIDRFICMARNGEI